MFESRSTHGLVLVLAVAAGQSHLQAADIGSDRAAIVALNRLWEERVNAHDATGLADLYTDDCVRMPDGAPTSVGRRALERAYRKEFAPQWNMGGRESIITDEVVIAGNYAFARGSDRFTRVEKGITKTEFGKWVATYRRQRDGSWKYYWSTYNSNGPH